MNAAIRAGARQLVLGFGGSATVDGGVGAMKALGIRFLDEHGKEIPEGGLGLLKLHQIDLTPCAWSKKNLELILLADVENPLLGKQGAAPIFGPQKGASPSQVRILTRALTKLDHAIRKLSGKSVRNLPSGGAAGGAIAGFYGILNEVPGVRVRIISGIDYVLQTLNVENAVKKADWIFTGEGHLDSQTLRGKTISGLVRLARKHHKPVVAFAGKISLNRTQIRRLGLHAAYAITPSPCTFEQSKKNAFPWLQQIAFRVTRLLTQ
jgi:glycerate 2-kinase